MKNRIIAVMGLALLGGYAGLAAAQPATAARPSRPDPPTLQREIGLSDEQAAQMRRLRSEERKQAIRRRADLAIARMELEEALDAPSVDEKLVGTRVRAVSDLQAAEVRARADRRLAMRKMLTPEQQGKLKQLMRERGGAHGAGWRGGRSRRPARGAMPEGAGGPPGDPGEDRAEPGR